MQRFASWWQQPVPYEQLKTHLVSHGIDLPVRLIVSSISAMLALTALSGLLTATQPSRPLDVAAAVAATAGAVAGAVLWALRWPTRRQSVAFSVVANASIAAVALTQPDPASALLTCTVFSALAGYIAIFHGRVLLVYNFAVAAAISVVEADHSMHQTSAGNTFGAVVVVFVLNFASPAGIQLAVRGLGADAKLAERDHLTGLLTRAAFHRKVLARVDVRRADQHLVLVVIDLDRFKMLNDRHGHGHGDAALVGVAQALRNALADDAVIGRSGGEEFVVAGLWRLADVAERLERVRLAIATLPFEVTASIGSATTRAAPSCDDVAQLVTNLTDAADAAMYVAKRRGGNQTHCVHWDPPRTVAASDRN